MLNNKDYCDYDTCVALKELGYNYASDYRCDTIENMICNIPTITLWNAQKWLRGEKIYIDVACNRGEESIFYDYEIITMSDCTLCDKFYSSYEEALLEGVKTCVKILKERGC